MKSGFQAWERLFFISLAAANYWGAFRIFHDDTSRHAEFALDE
jgi:hypothetical protein